MNVVAVQLYIVWEDKEANFDCVRTLVENTVMEAGSLIVLPEMFATGFSMDVAHIAEEPGGMTETFLAELAREYSAYVVAGVVTKASDGRGRNEALAVAPSGEIAARYCKLHPFTYGDEDKHYAAGEEIATFGCGDFVAAPFICYDLRFPEAFRAAVSRGATLFPVIANWPEAREKHWTALLQARAIENQAYVVGVNRCGNDKANTYSGRSMIVDPMGTVLAAAEPGQGLLHAVLEREALEEYRERFPALNDMRDLFKLS